MGIQNRKYVKDVEFLKYSILGEESSRLKYSILGEDVSAIFMVFSKSKPSSLIPLKSHASDKYTRRSTQDTIETKMSNKLRFYRHGVVKRIRFSNRYFDNYCDIPNLEDLNFDEDNSLSDEKDIQRHPEISNQFPLETFLIEKKKQSKEVKRKVTKPAFGGKSRKIIYCPSNDFPVFDTEKH